MLALCALLLLCLAGCKATDVLTEHVEDEELGVLDATMEPRYQENPEAEVDNRKTSDEVKDSERIDAQEESIPVYNPDAEEDGTAIWRVYDENSPYDKTAAQGTLVEESDEQNKETESDTETDEKSSTSENTEESEEGTEKKDDGDVESEEKGKAKVSAGSGGTGETYDASGKKAKLPENCNKVAAVGTYATIVQMLGGEGGLVATDSYWKKQVSARGLFPDEGTDEIASGWSSDSEGEYKISVKKIIKAEPDAILVDGVTCTLTDSQKKKLSNANIDIITVPTLGESGTTDANIISAVNIVGELLKNSTTVTYSTQQTANVYEQMHETTLSNCVSALGGYAKKTLGGSSTSTIFQNDASGNTQTTSNLSDLALMTALVDAQISANKSTITVSRAVGSKTLYLNGSRVDASDGVGVSASVANGNYALVDYYLQTAGVVNNAYETEKPTSGSNGTSTPVVLLAGSPAKSDNDFVDSSSARGRTDVALSALWYSETEISLDSAMTTVGDANAFPGLIARTEEIAQFIVKSANNTNGLYNVGQPYSVWVMPSGIDGSWSVGTPESYLVSVWALKTIWGDSDASEQCDEYIDTYYKTFYRCSDGTDKVTDYETVYTAQCPTN